MVFERKIRQALLWMQLAAFARALASGAVAVAVVLLGTVVAAKLILPHPDWQAAWLAGAAAGAVVCAWAFLRRRTTPASAALALDELYHLNERMVTALHARTSDHPFREAILADAEEHCRSVVPRKVARANLRSPLLAALGVGIVAASTHWFAPGADLLGHKSRLQAQETVKKAVAVEARKLEALEKKFADGRTSGTELQTSKRIAEDIAELRRELSAAQAPDARETMARLSSLAEKIGEEKERLKKEADTGQGVKALTSESDRETRRLERALRRGDMEMAKAELARLGQQAAMQGESTSAPARLGTELQQLAGAVAGQEKLSRALAETGSALAARNPEAAKAGFEDAQKALGDIAAMQTEMQKLDEALTQIEKSKSDLAQAANGEGTSPGSGGESQSGESKAGGSEAGSRGDKPGSGAFEIGSAGSGGARAGAASESGQGTESASASGAGSKSASGSGAGKSGEAGSASEGSAGPDWGIGTTNLDGGGAYTPVADGGSPRQQGRTSNWTEEFVKLYDPRAMATKNFNTQSKGKIGEGQFAYSVEVEGQASREAPKVEAARAFLDYREAQKDALAKEDIPLGYKEFVKNYFDSIEPPK
jgi:hypothetical protein